MGASEFLVIDYKNSSSPKKFVTSLRETGFASIENLPFSSEQIIKGYELWSQFFHSDKKFEYRVQPGSQTGFFPFRSENAKGSDLKDLKEFFHVYPKCELPDFLQEITFELYENLLQLGRTLLEWIQAETPPEISRSFSEPLPDMLNGSDSNLLRVLHYPPLEHSETPAGAVRAFAHEDINLLTLLVAGSAPGLQARDSLGDWHNVPCDLGMIVVNSGDMMALLTNNFYKSTTHRVLNPSISNNVSRFSMPMFLHPRPTVRLDADYTAGEFLEERLFEIGLK